MCIRDSLKSYRKEAYFGVLSILIGTPTVLVSRYKVKRKCHTQSQNYSFESAIYLMHACITKKKVFTPVTTFTGYTLKEVSSSSHKII